MAKSADAFRTISEVSEWLDTPAHVLRFWESKFTQVKPVKRAGGRRYYRPSDMELLGGIKRLLHEDGMTIKGAQKLLREKGVAHVAAMSQPLDDVTAAVRDAMDSKAIEAKKAARAAEQQAEAAASQPSTSSDAHLAADPAVMPDTSPETPAPSVEAEAAPEFGTAAAPAPTSAPGALPQDAPQDGIAAAAADSQVSLSDIAPFRAPPPAGPVAAATPVEVAEATPTATATTGLLAAIYNRKAPLPVDHAAQVSALRGRLQGWLAKELG